MVNHEGLPQKIKEFLAKEIEDPSFQKSEIFLCRTDGVLVFTANSDESQNDSLGVLLCGAWQALKTLMDFGQKNEWGEDEFRLSFDSSSSGIYLLPVPMKEGGYFLGSFYKNKANPAPFKMKLKGLRDRLSEFISHQMKDYFEGPKENNHKEKFLFHDITDEEMDHLFNFNTL